jgi:tRNA-2-methylthio-N6-dimethylallyladenosine synthase
MQIAVGGCMAQKDRETIVLRAPWVDVVFGTHNIGSLPALLERARHNKAQVEILESLRCSRRRCRPPGLGLCGLGLDQVGCNNTCTFCIVPSLRGKEQDRRPGEILAEIEALVAKASSRSPCSGRTSTPTGWSSVTAAPSRSCCAPAGVSRDWSGCASPRPHPAEFTDDVIEAMAETPNVMPQLHMPLQSGSDTDPARDAPLLPREKFLGIIDTGPRRDPGCGHHHRHHRRLPRRDRGRLRRDPGRRAPARFSAAFTFQYSIRPGTPAATMPDQVPKAVVQERFDRLIALQEEVSWAENRALEGRQVEVLVAPGRAARTGPRHG